MPGRSSCLAQRIGKAGVVHEVGKADDQHHCNNRQPSLADGQSDAAQERCAPEDEGMAVCLLPGTELSFDDQVRRANNWPWNGLIRYKTAIFRQINKDKRCTHHDALEFPNGQLVLLTLIMAGQRVTVLQLPAAPESVKPKEELVVTRAVEPDLADAIS